MSNMVAEPENRWLRYGLATSPYFPEALGADTKGPRPITLFCGRARQVKQLVDMIAGEESSLSIVEGPSGTGKSTFVNYAKHALRRQDDSPLYFAPSVEVGVQSDANAQTLLVQVIDGFVRHASDLYPKAKWQKDYPAVHKARTMVEAIQSLSGGWGFGLFAPGGPGASVSRSKSASTTTPLIGPVLSPAFFAELCGELRQLRDPAMRGVIVHVNNMDVLLAENPAAAVRLFADLRDHFQVAGMHWIFLGPPGLYDEAVAIEKRVRDFVKLRIELDALPAKEVHDLLQARYHHYHELGTKLVEPVEPRLIEELYDFFGGDLRGTLNAANKALGRHNPVDVAPMPTTAARQALQAEYRAQLEANLRGKTLAILQHLIQRGKPTFSQDDATPVEKHQPNRSDRFKELLQADAIRLTGSSKTRKIYSFSGQSRLAFRAP